MIKCPVCQSTKTNIYLKDVESVYSSRLYSIYACKSCGHFFTYPAPTKKELDQIYSKKYSYTAHSIINPEKRKRAKRYARYISDLKVKDAFEIGAMHGLLIKELNLKGVKASGIELDKDAVAYCKAHGLDVTQSSLEDFSKKSSKKYDLIIMSHVLEHILKPAEQVGMLKKHLNKNGRLMIIVPNSNAKTRKVFGRYWGYWQVPIHVNHFNSRSITKLLSNCGLRVKDISYVGADSLFFLSSLANRMGAKNESHDLSSAKKAAVKVNSVLLRPWLYAGSEDMIVLGQIK